MSTWGAWSFQVQKTETVVPSSRAKLTRIHVVLDHTRIDQPGSGVADTSSADVAPISKTTRPPSVA